VLGLAKNTYIYWPIECTPGLKNLPTSIGQWSALQDFDLWGCLKTQELPTSIG